MPNVLTTGTSVTCGHQGKVSTNGTAKLTVNGQNVLLRSGVEGQSVKNNPPADLDSCTTKKTNTTSPCAAVLSVSTGEATKLKVGGKPVLLDTLMGTTNGNPPGTLSVQANQSKLRAM